MSYTILGSFPEQAKLQEIAKYSHFTIQAMQFTDAGLVPAEAKKPVPKKTYR